MNYVLNRKVKLGIRATRGHGDVHFVTRGDSSGAALVLDQRASALIDALQQRKIAGAGLDVFPQEPIRRDHPLLALDNVLLTPHTAGHAFEGWARRCEFAWLNIRRVAAGASPLSLARPG